MVMVVVVVGNGIGSGGGDEGDEREGGCGPHWGGKVVGEVVGGRW